MNLNLMLISILIKDLHTYCLQHHFLSKHVSIRLRQKYSLAQRDVEHPGALVSVETLHYHQLASRFAPVLLVSNNIRPASALPQSYDLHTLGAMSQLLHTLPSAVVSAEISVGDTA